MPRFVMGSRGNNFKLYGVRWRLNEIFDRFHRERYLSIDPLVCVRQFSDLPERECFGLLAACLSYGRVENIIADVRRIIAIAGDNPLAYIRQVSYRQKKQDLRQFKHRFNTGADVALLLETMKVILDEFGSLEGAFQTFYRSDHDTIRLALEGFIQLLRDTAAHIDEHSRSSFGYLLTSPVSGSACKRMNMFLRWMIRPDDGIDLGIWRCCHPSRLIIPVDVHVARAARYMRLTTRASADWRMAQEITANLKKFDPDDPVKYDFSLCRYGMILFRKEQST